MVVAREIGALITPWVMERFIFDELLKNLCLAQMYYASMKRVISQLAQVALLPVSIKVNRAHLYSYEEEDIRGRDPDH